MYNDYPAISDSYDTDQSIDESMLDAAADARWATMEKLGELSREGDSDTVLGVYYRDIDRARIARGEAMERCFRDLDRFDSTITALYLELEMDDAEGYDPDDVSEAA